MPVTTHSTAVLEASVAARLYFDGTGRLRAAKECAARALEYATLVAEVTRAMDTALDAALASRNQDAADLAVIKADTAAIDATQAALTSLDALLDAREAIRGALIPVLVSHVAEEQSLADALQTLPESARLS